MKYFVIFIMIIGVGFPIASAQYILELPPLKQFNADVPFDKIHCKDGLVLIQKYDVTPACVKPETVPKIFERNWLPSQKLWNEVKRQDVFPNSEEFSQIVRTKTDTVQEASELVDFNIMTPSYLPPNYEIKSVIVLSSDAVMGFAGIEEITEKTNPSDYLWNGGMMFYQTHIPTANERFTDLQDRLEHITTPYVLGNTSAFVNWHYIKYDGNELISMMPTLWTVKDDTYTTIHGNVSEQQLVAMAGSMHGCFSDCVTESTKTKLVERGWTGYTSITNGTNTNTNQDNWQEKILKVQSRTYCSVMDLDRIPKDQIIYQKRVGTNALMLNVNDDDLKQVPHLQEMILAMNNSTGFVPYQYQENTLVKEISSSGESQHSMIWNWLKEMFKSQYTERQDGSFSSYFEYGKYYYDISWSLC